MMKTFFAVSRCLSCKKTSNGLLHLGQFHFKGVLWGMKIKEILVFSELEFQKGRNYALYLILIAESEGILKTKLIKQKPLDMIERNFF